MPRSYSDADIAKALAALKSNKGNLSQTSEQVGIPISTISDWAKQKRNRVKAKPFAELRKEKELTLANECEKVLWKILKHGLAPKKLKEATASQNATAFGIFTDKMRILRDQGPPPSEAAKTASEAIRQAAAALVALSHGTKKPMNLEAAEAQIKQIQIETAQLASEATQ
jgi:hypothetical protein